MKIWLCHKSYNIKITQGAKRAFNDEHKRDLLGTIQEVMLCFLSGGGVADLETQSKARAVITEVQAASLLHSIISAGSPRIQLEEVEDAIARLPWRISESTDDRCLPWPTVIHQIGLGYDEMMGGISTGKKPSADTLDFLGQK